MNADSAVTAPADLRPPQQGKLDAIDYAVDKLGVRSFADLGGIGRVHGQYAFYAADKSGVVDVALADERIDPWAIQEAERRNVRYLVGDFASADVATQIGPTDAVVLFDVLLHQARPDWDEVLGLYARQCRCMLIGNPQWQLGLETVRLLDMGREKYLNTVPPSTNHDQIFDKLDEWSPKFNRYFRDAPLVWQWGITDRDLISTLWSYGFELERRVAFGTFWKATGFLNTSFVFRAK